MKSADMQYVPNFSSKARNQAKLQYSFQIAQFSLGRGDEEATRRYYSRYDQLHPHVLLQSQYAAAQPTRWWTMRPKMMLIFRNNFSEVVEFSTTFSAGERPEIRPGTFKSYVNVRCKVCRIKLDLKRKRSFGDRIIHIIEPHVVLKKAHHESYIVCTVRRGHK